MHITGLCMLGWRRWAATSPGCRHGQCFQLCESVRVQSFTYSAYPTTSNLVGVTLESCWQVHAAMCFACACWGFNAASSRGEAVCCNMRCNAPQLYHHDRCYVVGVVAMAL